MCDVSREPGRTSSSFASGFAKSIGFRAKRFDLPIDFCESGSQFCRLRAQTSSLGKGLITTLKKSLQTYRELFILLQALPLLRTGRRQLVLVVIDSLHQVDEHAVHPFESRLRAAPAFFKPRQFGGNLRSLLLRFLPS